MLFKALLEPIPITQVNLSRKYFIPAANLMDQILTHSPKRILWISADTANESAAHCEYSYAQLPKSLKLNKTVLSLLTLSLLCAVSMLQRCNRVKNKFTIFASHENERKDKVLEPQHLLHPCLLEKEKTSCVPWPFVKQMFQQAKPN